MFDVINIKQFVHVHIYERSAIIINRLLNAKSTDNVLLWNLPQQYHLPALETLPRST